MTSDNEEARERRMDLRSSVQHYLQHVARCALAYEHAIFMEPDPDRYEKEFTTAVSNWRAAEQALRTFEGTSAR